MKGEQGNRLSQLTDKEQGVATEFVERLWQYFDGQVSAVIRNRFFDTN